jgi:hypothetical protein
MGSLDDFGSHENPDGHRNTHWSVNVPAHAQREFRQSVERLLMKLVGLRELGAAIMFQVLDERRLGGHAKYLTKGIRPDAADYFHVIAEDQGFVSGRGRTFVSRSLGFKARAAAGWKRKRRPRSPATPSAN